MKHWLTIGMCLGVLALPVVAAESSPKTLRTINDYLTGQPVQSAVADGTVYVFRATVPKVNFWKTSAPLDGLWMASADNQTMTWMSSTSGADATTTTPCPGGASGGGGGGSTDCQNNSPTPTNNGCVCQSGWQCCPPSSANCYDPATKVCCGGTTHDIGTGCCVGDVWVKVNITGGDKFAITTAFSLLSDVSPSGGTYVWSVSGSLVSIVLLNNQPSCVFQAGCTGLASIWWTGSECMRHGYF